MIIGLLKILLCNFPQIHFSNINIAFVKNLKDLLKFYCHTKFCNLVALESKVMIL